MTEHYANAACRHLSDSRVLLDASHWDGCAYLAGYVIECSLKAVIASPEAPPEVNLRELGHDLSKLHFQLDQMASSRQTARKRHVPGRLLTALRAQLETMQPGWKPSMRYHSKDPAWQNQATNFWRLADRCFKGFARTLVTEVNP
jgi:HEPN domain-containing protein